MRSEIARKNAIKASILNFIESIQIKCQDAALDMSFSELLVSSGLGEPITSSRARDLRDLDNLES